jgi:hypothetical protein
LNFDSLAPVREVSDEISSLSKDIDASDERMEEICEQNYSHQHVSIEDHFLMELDLLLLMPWPWLYIPGGVDQVNNLYPSQGRDKIEYR